MIHVSETENSAGVRVFTLDSGSAVLGRAYVEGDTVMRVEMESDAENHRAFLLRSVVFALVPHHAEVRAAFTDSVLAEIGFVNDTRGGMSVQSIAVNFKAGCSCNR